MRIFRTMFGLSAKALCLDYQPPIVYAFVNITAKDVAPYPPGYMVQMV